MTTSYTSDHELTTRGLGMRMSSEAERFSELMQEKVAWSKLPAGKKRGYVKWGLEENRSSTRIQGHRGNQMVIPTRDLVVFDLDVKPGDFSESNPDPARRMRSILAEQLGVSHRDLTTVRTPSGGMHIYVPWGDSDFIPVLDVDNLKKLHPELKGDMRTSAKNSYLVAPGSWISTEELHNDNKLPSPEYITWRGFNDERSYYYTEQWGTLQALDAKKSREIYTVLEGDKATEEAEQAKKAEQREQVRNKILNENLGGNDTYHVLKRIENNGHYIALDRFHQKRAWVYRAISCHYSNDEIIEICIKLNIDIDSNGGSPQPLSQKELEDDINRLSASVVCSGVCGQERAHVHIENIGDSTPEELIARARARERAPKVWRTYSVVNLLKAADFIMRQGKRKKPGKLQRLAYEIVRNELNEHSLLGRKNIVLGLDYLQKQYGVNRSAASHALRILRNAGIIFIKRKQAEERLPIYRVSDKFIEQDITKCLRKTISVNSEGIKLWNWHHSDVDWVTGMITVFDTETGSIHDFHSGKLEKMGNILRFKHDYFYDELDFS